MLDVKISSRGSGRNLNLSQFLGNEVNEWEGCRFWVNSPVKRADVWIVIEDLDDDDVECEVPTDAVLFASAETSWVPGFFDTDPDNVRFLDQFAWIYTCHDVYRKNVTASLPFLPWMVNANHGPSISAPHHRNLDFLRELRNVEKTEELSVICSTQTATEGHRQRLRFVTALKEHFGERLHWYGNGVNPIEEKWSGLAQYRFTVAIENQVADNVVTEKLWDPLLTWTVPLYVGAPNAIDYVPSNAMRLLSLQDINGSISTVEQLLNGDEYSGFVPHLAEARDRLLGPLHLYTRLANLARQHQSSSAAELVRLTPRDHLALGQARRRRPWSMLRSRSGELLKTLGSEK